MLRCDYVPENGDPERSGNEHVVSREIPAISPVHHHHSYRFVLRGLEAGYAKQASFLQIDGSG